MVSFNASSSFHSPSRCRLHAFVSSRLDSFCFVWAFFCVSTTLFGLILYVFFFGKYNHCPLWHNIFSLISDNFIVISLTLALPTKEIKGRNFFIKSGKESFSHSSSCWSESKSKSRTRELTARHFHIVSGRFLCWHRCAVCLNVPDTQSIDNPQSATNNNPDRPYCNISLLQRTHSLQCDRHQFTCYLFANTLIQHNTK